MSSTCTWCRLRTFCLQESQMSLTMERCGGGSRRCPGAARAKSTTLSVARAKRGTTRSLPDKVGKFSKRVDTALLGKHTQQLCNQCTWKEATVLAQLRTGIARLNSYLVLIKADGMQRVVPYYYTYKANCDMQWKKVTALLYIFKSRFLDQPIEYYMSRWFPWAVGRVAMRKGPM